MGNDAIEPIDIQFIEFIDLFFVFAARHAGYDLRVIYED
jgi:hypothetical protein